MGRPECFVFITILLVGVAGFFRCGELLVKNRKQMNGPRTLQVGHVAFYPDRASPEFMSIFLSYSKTDKYGIRNGISILIPANPLAEFCPVQHMLMLVTDRDIMEPCFKWPNGRVVTKDSFVRMLKEMLKKTGVDDKAYSDHSMRRGAAISAKAAGCSDSLIQMLGRWSSDSYKIYLRNVPVKVSILNERLKLMRLVQTS
jgi:hypothetical protein